MKSMKRFLFTCCAGVILPALFLAGCSKKAEQADTGYDFYIFNSKGENAVQMEAMARAYQEETGVRVKVFSIGAGTDSAGPLATEMNSRNMPTVYSIGGLNDLDQWLDGGYVVDFSTVADPAFAKLAADIPQSIRLSKGGATNYGIPYNIEGYGYIVDRQMIADIFGAENTDAVLADTITASYAEWEALVNALDSWIKAPSAAGVSLSGKAYTLRPGKTALTENLNGVFAVMGAEQWTYGDHLINIPLNAAFSSVNDAANASAERLRDLTKPLIEYARALDFKTRHLAGKNGPASRGQDLVSPANFGYDQTVQIFAEGKALFLKQGNWAYNNIANINRETAERLSFLPVKMPFAQSDITAPGVTVEKLNRSIPAFVPNYYAVNALARESEKKAAYDFLVWMNTTPAGQRFVVDEMAFIPYNADPAVTRVSNSLGNSIISYMAKGDTMPDVWHGFPVTWAGDIAGRYIKENYLVKAAWTEADYEQFASYAVEQLIELRK